MVNISDLLPDTPPEPSFDWFISSARTPRVHAFFEPTPGSRYSETYTGSNLTVPEGSFLLLVCAAFYNITWSSDKARDTRAWNSNRCREMTPAPELQAPSMECLSFESVKPSDEGAYTCYQEAGTDPGLVTTVHLRVARKSTSPNITVVKQSFDQVYTLTHEQVELTVEYETGRGCKGGCNTSWILLPNTVLDGRWDSATNQIIASSEATAYAYVEKEQISPTRYRSRLIMPSTCNKNSGMYHFHIEDMVEKYPIDFRVTVEFMPTRSNRPEVLDKDGHLYRARLLPGRMYEIRASTPPFGPVLNRTSRLEFFNRGSSGNCQIDKARFIQTAGPSGGYIKTENAVTNSSAKCSSPGALTERAPIPMFHSSFVLRADDFGKVTWIVDWTYKDSSGIERRNSSQSEFQIKIVDREEFLNDDLLIERDPVKEALIGDALTVRCIAPICLFDQIILEKESNTVRALHDHGIAHNDFPEAETKYENTSLHAIVSLTFPKSSRFSGGLFACSAFDNQVPLNTRVEMTVEMVPPMPPMFDITDDYTQRVYLAPSSRVPLSCSAFGKPTPDIAWFFNGHPLTPEVGKLDRDNLTATVSRLGVYMCRVTNRYKRIEREFHVVDGEMERKEEQKAYVTKAVVGTVCAVVLLLMVCLVLWFIRQWRLASVRRVHSAMLKPSKATVPLESFMPVNDQIESLAYDERYEVDKSAFTVSSVLGSGEYGKVYKGVLKTQNGGQDVALKSPRETVNVEHHKALISELKIMIYVRHHINVLRVLGACTKDIQHAGFYIITEYCDRGSLRDYLLKNRDKSCASCEFGSCPISTKRSGSQYSKNIRMFQSSGAITKEIKHGYVNVQEGHQCSFFTVDKLLSYAYQSASGMEYLAAKNVVHRDLALRNLLLHGDVVKIADFGLSRHHQRNVYKSRKFDCPLPFFWMALESILSYKYTEKSDVWSFGVVLWELFSLGDAPYPGKRPDNQFVQWLREGNRMDAPKVAPSETYDLMKSCWNKDPDTRPTFSECKRRLGQHLDDCCGDAYRAMLLVLASAKSNGDYLHIAPFSRPDWDKKGNGNPKYQYTMVGETETAKSDSHSDSSGLEMVVLESPRGSLCGGEIEMPSLASKTKEQNIYQAPIY